VRLGPAGFTAGGRGERRGGLIGVEAGEFEPASGAGGGGIGGGGEILPGILGALVAQGHETEAFVRQDGRGVEEGTVAARSGSGRPGRFGVAAARRPDGEIRAGIEGAAADGDGLKVARGQVGLDLPVEIGGSLADSVAEGGFGIGACWRL